MNSCDYTIVGAGITGATIARILADSGKSVLVLEKNGFVGGSCYDIVINNLPVCQFGGHIFHTNDKEVWDFVNKYSEFYPYEHRVVAINDRIIYPLPINLLTLNSLGLDKDYFKNLPYIGDSNFEERAISKIGKLLYEKFFLYYTMKQWGVHPRELPASIFSRLPVRTNMDTRYFSDRYQGMPVCGYTKLIENMLDHKNIDVQLNRTYDKGDKYWGSPICTGGIDQFYNFQYGELEYRTTSLDWNIETEDNYGGATINYTGSNVNFTRTMTFNHFYPHIQTNKYITATEYFASRKNMGGDPLYPVPTEENLKLYERYKAMDSGGMIFAGRLGKYRYINMDVAIREAMELVKGLL